MEVVSRRVRRSRSERAATLVEFAIAFPVLALLLLGLIDFGVNYSNKVQIANAARAAARSGAMTNTGSSTNCALNPAGSLALGTQRLICNAKARTRIDPDKVAVKIMYMGRNGKQVNALDPDPLVNDYSIIVCVSAEAYSVTGMLGPILDGRFQHSRAVAKTGTRKPELPQIEPGQEVPLVVDGVSDNWNFCTADDPNGTEA